MHPSLDILFINESSILPELDLIKRELIEQGFSSFVKVDFNNGFEMLKTTRFACVLINAHDKKIEAYEFCLRIRSSLGADSRVFVYMPQASLNEASKFGKLNTEIIDLSSLSVMIDTLKAQDANILTPKKIHSIVSINGGLGASTLTILLAFAIHQYKKSTLILETNNKFSVRDLLGINQGKPFLTRDRGLEHKQILDQKWFKGFLQISPQHSYAKYLDLFTNTTDKISYSEKTAFYCENLIEQINLIGHQEIKPYQLSMISDSLRLIAQDLRGDSGVLLDELVKFLYSADDEVLIDLGLDHQNILNRQFLDLSKNIILLFSDKPGTKSILMDLRNYFLERFSANIIGVFVCDIENFAFYQNISDADWIGTVGFVPIIMPREPDLVTAFIYDNECISKDSRTYTFLKNLLVELGINSLDLPKPKSSGFKFLKYV
jgi:cellulose biosynthesis protein BcsQ